ncbi:MAG: DotU family type IV/VI secretion system protein [Phycisphaerales bacterium]|nr:MAG: DotU family type IV/VI secretion system protein [Phycisphaerales bacterium]
MTLLELCEPLFQYMCRLRRSARMGRTMEMDEVRNNIVGIFSEMKAEASSNHELLTQYEKIELPLIFFADFTIKEGNLPFSYDWIELARERNELAGDEKFFDLLDADLADPSDSATQRLAVFYTCLGLGFTGVYTGQLESIQRLISQISARISGLMDADKKSYICPDAYENVDTRDLIEPPGAKLMGIGITLAALFIIWAVSYCFLFKWTSDDLAESLEVIAGQQTPSAVVE